MVTVYHGKFSQACSAFLGFQHFARLMASEVAETLGEIATFRMTLEARCVQRMANKAIEPQDKNDSKR